MYMTACILVLWEICSSWRGC